MSWTANNKYYLTGSITSGLTLSKNNADAGTVPSGVTVLTYNDETYNDSTYDITAIYQGTFESSFSTNDVNWISSGDNNDIKYQIATSDDGITYSDFSTESDAISTTQIAVNAPYFKLRLTWYSSQWTDSDSFNIDSITRKFTVFENGGNIDANEWMSNFYVVGADNLLPREGAAMALTNSSVNIGSSAHEWKDVHLNELNVSGDIGGTLNLIASTTLSTTAQRIEFSGLIDTTYFISASFVIDTTSADDSFLFFNGDSATNYGYQGHYSTSGFYATTTAGIFIGTADSGTSVYSCFDGWIFANAAFPKMLAGSGAYGVGTNTIEHVFAVGGVWDNSSATVTSIVLYNNSKFDAGTEVKLWSRK